MSYNTRETSEIRVSSKIDHTALTDTLLKCLWYEIFFCVDNIHEKMTQFRLVKINAVFRRGFIQC